MKTKNKIMTEQTFPEWEKNINNILDNIDKISNNKYFKRKPIKVEYKNKK
jgi:hypothetical protein|tara:strand:+ start:1446 stop:1595 length:150 start_codon:yes stop_codon:yes gene_type:complete